MPYPVFSQKPEKCSKCYCSKQNCSYFCPKLKAKKRKGHEQYMEEQLQISIIFIQYCVFRGYILFYKSFIFYYLRSFYVIIAVKSDNIRHSKLHYSKQYSKNEKNGNY